ncbi:hypothetical protein [Streptomyces sp. NPDC048419]|uniref:hypothetical protein n=1 Tax=Streptomyces sp. NPDC048419 TaxID=3365547 RepID=UPI003713BDA9
MSSSVRRWRTMANRRPARRFFVGCSSSSPPFIQYAYSVGDDKWGRWFQRAVRLPTKHLEVQLAFPAALDPVVWGTETSMTAEAAPLRTAPVRTEEDGMRVFTWNTTAPALHARYRLEGRMRAVNTSEGEPR